METGEIVCFYSSDIQKPQWVSVICLGILEKVKTMIEIKGCSTCRWFDHNKGFYNFVHEFLAPCTWPSKTAPIPDALKLETPPYIKRSAGTDCATYSPERRKIESN